MSPIRLYLETLGCSKNLVDSEALLGLLPGGDFIVQDEADGADLILLNTCSFISDAREQSVNRILELALLKERFGCKLVVFGCLPERYEGELLAEMPEIDLLAGVGRQRDLASSLKQLFAGGDAEVANTLPRSEDFDGFAGFRGRPLLTPPHLAFVKIAEGCNRGCSFCAIPEIRGRFRSRPIAEIVDEARGLAEKGVREINLISQDTAFYGRDRPRSEREGLIELAAGLGEINELHWIRLFYLHPALVDLDFLLELYAQPKVVPYLDMPVQHGSDKMLKLMRRGHDIRGLEKLLTELRRTRPDIVLRSTVLVGHPGETETDFEALLEFLERQPFDKLGVFAYSPEEGTKAPDLGQAPDAELVAERIERVQVAQMAHSEERGRLQIGRRLWGFVEANVREGEALPPERCLDPLSSAPYDDARAAIRTERDAYEVDGHVFLADDEGLALGDFIEVEVLEADVYDLKGRVICP